MDTFSNKKEKLQALISEVQPDIIGLVEISLKNKQFDLAGTEYEIDNYNMFRSESNKRGAALSVRKEHGVSSSDLTEAEFEESVWCQIKLKGGDRLPLGRPNVSRSPNSDLANNRRLQKLLKVPSHMLILWLSLY